MQEKAHRVRITSYRQSNLKLGSSFWFLSHWLRNVFYGSLKINHQLGLKAANLLMRRAQNQAGSSKALYPSSLESWMQLKCVHPPLFLMDTQGSLKPPHLPRLLLKYANRYLGNARERFIVSEVLFALNKMATLILLPCNVVCRSTGTDPKMALTITTGGLKKLHLIICATAIVELDWKESFRKDWKDNRNEILASLFKFH